MRPGGLDIVDSFALPRPRGWRGVISYLRVKDFINLTLWKSHELTPGGLSSGEPSVGYRTGLLKAIDDLETDNKGVKLDRGKIVVSRLDRFLREFGTDITSLGVVKVTPDLVDLESSASPQPRERGDPDYFLPSRPAMFFEASSGVKGLAHFFEPLPHMLKNENLTETYRRSLREFYRWLESYNEMEGQGFAVKFLGLAQIDGVYAVLTSRPERGVILDPGIQVEGELGLSQDLGAMIRAAYEFALKNGKASAVGSVPFYQSKSGVSLAPSPFLASSGRPEWAIEDRWRHFFSLSHVTKNQGEKGYFQSSFLALHKRVASLIVENLKVVRQEHVFAHFDRLELLLDEVYYNWSSGVHNIFISGLLHALTREVQEQVKKSDINPKLSSDILNFVLGFSIRKALVFGAGENAVPIISRDLRTFKGYRIPQRGDTLVLERRHRNKPLNLAEREQSYFSRDVQFGFQIVGARQSGSEVVYTLEALSDKTRVHLGSESLREEFQGYILVWNN